MVPPIHTIRAATEKVLSQTKYLWLFVGSTTFFAWLYLIYPVLATPGNDLPFQLSITPWWGLLLIAFLALAAGLLTTLQAYLFRRHQELRAKEAVGTLPGSFSAFLANLFPPASCLACVSALFGFLGMGTVLFLLNYRWEIVGGSMALMVFAIYLASKRINHACLECGVPVGRAKEKGFRECMQCGSLEVKWHAGGMTGDRYDCQACGYLGVAVVENGGKKG